MASLKRWKESLEKNKIVDMIDEKNSTFGLPRGYLGMSQIGSKCSRSLWYYFRWCSASGVNGRINRIFQVGHKAEADMIKDLESIGIKTWDTLDSQAAFMDISEYFSGHSDGMGLGIPGAEKTIHLLEFKTSSDKYFKSIVKNGVEKEKYVHYCQMVLYMHYSKTKRALYMVYNKNDSSYYTERVKNNPGLAKDLIRKAGSIIFSENHNDFEKIGNKTKSWFECKFCAYSDLCHDNKKPLKNCRTCINCDLIGNGRFACSLDKSSKEGYVLNLEEQSKGCNEHQYLECFND